ncbi:twin-arginine translocation signal domain-containing protein [Natrialba sp. SSL1]|uniref:twin-arginine translocation signal domain-containing protein n=1 Tax=Natrialba sp. SSL1 TaxID=1869245 RepID=UPI00111380C8|nr:twin-arginine translocation signal domain-containing protein [Natrialba sp. SSL1]
MNGSGMERRDVLTTAAVSGCSLVLAGCTEIGASRSGYGSAYGREYGAGGA